MKIVSTFLLILFVVSLKGMESQLENHRSLSYGKYKMPNQPPIKFAPENNYSLFELQAKIFLLNHNKCFCIDFIQSGTSKNTTIQTIKKNEFLFNFGKLPHRDFVTSAFPEIATITRQES